MTKQVPLQHTLYCLAFAPLLLFSRVSPPPLQATQTPTPDRLAEPIMPASPTQIDDGHYLYYYHCMTCHGDRGQGLTDEWREVWVDDHQNCWAHGCHTGREQAGFFIPRHVPPVSGLGRFQSTEALAAYLHQEHPPQNPGILSEDESWALTAYLLHQSGALPPDAQLGPGASLEPRDSAVIVATLGLVLTTLFFLWAKKRPTQRPT